MGIHRLDFEFELMTQGLRHHKPHYSPNISRN
jgi:hypothetical protein